MWPFGGGAHEREGRERIGWVGNGWSESGGSNGGKRKEERGKGFGVLETVLDFYFKF